jgi:hypothetical protein
MSSNTLIAFEARTETEYSCFLSSKARSVMFFFMFLGVEGFDAISSSVLMA